MQSLLGGALGFAWGVYSIVSLIGLIKLTHRLWKDDWFWFLTNKGYWFGWMFTLLYSIFLALLFDHLNDWALPAAFLIQLPISLVLLKKWSLPTIQDRLALFAFPFFTLVMWSALNRVRKIDPTLL